MIIDVQVQVFHRTKVACDLLKTILKAARRDQNIPSFSPVLEQVKQRALYYFSAQDRNIDR